MSIRVSDWIAQSLYKFGIKRVHGLMGGGAAGLNDGFIKNGKIQYICYHHEQSAGHSAVGESKFTGKLSVVNPTTGCGGTNCVTSVLNAWQDSVPVLFISGNVNKSTCTSFLNNKKKINLRSYGVQEHNIIDTIKSITKYSKFVENVDEIPKVFDDAISSALSPRKGPVWIDIPSDVQNSIINFSKNSQIKFKTNKTRYFLNNKKKYSKLRKLLKNSIRPLVLAGAGIRQSDSKVSFSKFIKKFNLPFVTSYASKDVCTDKNFNNLGAIGVKGSRSGNFAVANCDLLIILGCRLASSLVGYDKINFSKYSKKIMVDFDKNEFQKEDIKIDIKINDDLQNFFKKII